MPMATASVTKGRCLVSVDNPLQSVVPSLAPFLTARLLKLVASSSANGRYLKAQSHSCSLMQINAQCTKSPFHF